MTSNERSTVHFWERILVRIAAVLYRVTIYLTAARYLEFHIRNGRIFPSAFEFCIE